MGRGRQKAKDAKIARQLKYTNHGSDLRDLERELVSGTSRDSSKEEEREDSTQWGDDK